jgi:hypothetical protein
MLHIGGKIIYLVVIDICEHSASASKRGILKEFTVKEATLVSQIPAIAQSINPLTSGDVGASTANDT